MNPLVLILPTYRASASAFTLGLIVLALVDIIRLQLGFQPGLFGAIWFLGAVLTFIVLSLHINRLRHAGRGFGLAFLPIGLGIVGWAIGAFSGLVGGYLQAVRAFVSGQGGDDSDEALLDAIQDPGFQQAFQYYVNANQEVGLDMLRSGRWTGFIGFWLVIALFAIWFARMRSTQGRPPAEEG